MEIKYTQASRKHRIGKARIEHVLAGMPVSTEVNDRQEIQHQWLGFDQRGLELEVIAVETVDLRTGARILLVIHAMSTELRRRKG